jgi:uncharacterized protein (TIGR01732 family)
MVNVQSILVLRNIYKGNIYSSDNPKGGEDMGFGYGCGGYEGGGYGYDGGYGGSSFVLIVVLFILLIIVLSSWC